MEVEQRAHGSDDKPQPSGAPGPAGVSLSPPSPSRVERSACQPGSCRSSRVRAGLQPPAGPCLLCQQGFIFPVPPVTLGAGCSWPGFDSLAPSQAWSFPSPGKTGESEPASDWDDLLRSTGFDFFLPPPCASYEIPPSEQCQKMKIPLLRSRCRGTQRLPREQCLGQAGPPCLEERTSRTTLHKNIRLTRKPSCHICRERTEQERNWKLKCVKENDSLFAAGEAGWVSEGFCAGPAAALSIRER